MKKIFLWLLGVVVYYQLPAQSKLIITDNYNDGEIYEAQLNGLGLTQTVEFTPRNRGGGPISFIQHDSSYYGITDYYGIYDNGTLYRYDYPSDSITVLHDFVDDDPTDLIVGPNNTLYGTWGDGDLFSYNLSTNTFSKLGNSGGNDTYQQLMLASNGKIYGTTRNGGNNGDGVVFELNPVGNVITVLHHFSETDGERPRVELAEANDGVLYGVTSEGGAEDKGVIFSINPTTGAFAVEYEFDSSVSSSNPQTNLVVAPDGLLYGVIRQNTSSSGGGFNERVSNSSPYAFFSFNPATDQFLPKAELDRDDIGDGVYQLSPINGDIYGMTSDDGGDEGQGVLFKYVTAEDSVYQVLSFDDNIAWGEGKVLLAPGGQLIYGSSDSDYFEDGAIITVNATTQATDVKVVFNEYPAGEDPRGTLVQTNDNRFFGLADDGGRYDGGTIYEYLPGTRQVVGRYDFNYDSLYLYDYYLTAEPDGLLYGAVAYNGNGNISSRINPLLVGGGGGGGNSSPSTDARYLFSFNPETGDLDTLLNFNTVDGDYPRYAYQFDGDNLYGVLTSGGANNYGGIFRFNLQTKQYELLQDFDNTIIGRDPRQQVLVNGNLYGLTQAGAANSFGAIYKYDIANDQVTIIKSFASNDERATRSGFMLHSNGKIYLETYNINFGALLELDPSTDVITTEFFFNPQGVRALNQSNSNQISEGTDGRIYGSFYKTSSGNPRGIYAYDPTTDTFEELVAVRQVNSFQVLAVCIAPLANQPEDMTACAGKPWSVTLNSQNTASYEWKKDGAVIAGATSDVFSLDEVSAANAGTYTAVMTNACGTDSVSFTLTVSDIQLETSVSSVTCNGGDDGSITVIPAGGIVPFEYSLDGDTFQSDSVFLELPAGDYAITVRDANGCVATASATISQPDALSLSTTGKDETCEKGFISVTPFGGVGPYQYSLDGENYQDSEQIHDVSAGDYTVYVRDANGCVTSEKYVVGLVTALAVESVVTESTEYPENGSIALTVTGGATPYTYVWNTGDSTATISDLVPNDYSVIITDKNGCTLEESFTVGGVTSIADLERRQGIHVYPNPVVDQLQVRLPAATKIKSAKLFSQQGELLRSFRLNGGLNQLRAEGLKPGMYLLQLDNGVSTRIVIKK
ncbi:MAG: choice-of-anchor tandem repeat GloVer-containing protein [Bacteroidota bacterium]